jgi:Carboxypeptidase regulatory-like domain
MHRTGGTVAGADGEPFKDAWVTLPDTGRYASTDAQGRFRFDRLAPGSHRLQVRTKDGQEASAQLEVPGALVDIVLGDGKRKKRA